LKGKLAGFVFLGREVGNQHEGAISGPLNGGGLLIEVEMYDTTIFGMVFEWRWREHRLVTVTKEWLLLQWRKFTSFGGHFPKAPPPPGWINPYMEADVQLYKRDIVPPTRTQQSPLPPTHTQQSPLPPTPTQSPLLPTPLILLCCTMNQ
jgi:hypothetical protein